MLSQVIWENNEKISKLQYLYNLKYRLNKLYFLSKRKRKNNRLGKNICLITYTWVITHTHTPPRILRDYSLKRKKKSGPQNINIESTEAENLRKENKNGLEKLDGGWFCHLSFPALPTKASPKCI